MELNEIIEKVGKEKLYAAIKCDDASALTKLLEENGIGLSGDQLDFIAGGFRDAHTSTFDDPE